VLPEHRAECLAVGMNDFLSKPLEMDALREILARNFSARAKAHAV
jgi:CheY-like chemotaxis protein